MELLKEIYDQDIGLDKKDYSDINQVRKSARAVILNNNKIAIIYASKENYHKLPGGKLEENEDVITALKRESLEEAGCNIKNIKELGCIIEYKNKSKKLHISYGYLADADGDIKDPQFTEREKDQGFELIWLPIDEAISRMEKDSPENYHAKYIVARELTYLKKARELI